MKIWNANENGKTPKKQLKRNFIPPHLHPRLSKTPPQKGKKGNKFALLGNVLLFAPGHLFRFILFSQLLQLKNNSQVHFHKDSEPSSPHVVLVVLLLLVHHSDLPFPYSCFSTDP